MGRVDHLRPFTSAEIQLRVRLRQVPPATRRIFLKGFCILSKETIFNSE
jgi:hypothetical protein